MKAQVERSLGNGLWLGRSATGGPLLLQPLPPTATPERVAQRMALHHTLLPPALGAVEVEGQRWLLLEWVEGVPLLDALEQRAGPFPVAQVLGWADALLGLLAYLERQQPPWRAGLLQPLCLLVAHDSRPLLLALSWDEGDRPTPPYAAPEEPPSACSDLYALAATLFHLLAGVPPPSAAERLTGTPLPVLDLLNPRVPPAIAAWLASALALDPTERPGSAGAMQAHLHGTPEPPARGLPSEPDEDVTPTDLLPPVSPIPSTPRAPDLPLGELVRLSMGRAGPPPTLRLEKFAPAPDSAGPLRAPQRPPWLPLLYLVLLAVLLAAFWLGLR